MFSELGTYGSTITISFWYACQLRANSNRAIVMVQAIALDGKSEIIMVGVISRYVACFDVDIIFMHIRSTLGLWL